MRCIQLRSLWVRSQVIYYMDNVFLLSPSQSIHQADLQTMFTELQRDG